VYYQFDKIEVIFDILSHPSRFQIGFCLLQRNFSIDELIRTTQRTREIITKNLEIMSDTGIVETYFHSGMKLFKLNDSFEVFFKSVIRCSKVISLL